MAPAELEPIANCNWVPLRPGQKLADNSPHTIVSITPTLSDREFTRYHKTGRPSVDFKVATDGAVFVVVGPRWLDETDSPGKTHRQVLEAQGWQQVSAVVTHMGNGGEGAMLIFGRACRKGESFTFSSPGKSFCPMVIR